MCSIITAIYSTMRSFAVPNQISTMFHYLDLYNVVVYQQFFPFQIASDVLVPLHLKGSGHNLHLHGLLLLLPSEQLVIVPLAPCLSAMPYGHKAVYL